MAAHRFMVIVHDVAAPFLPELAEIVRRVRPLVGGALAGAVTPRWGGTEPPGAASELACLARESFGELLLHGLSHSYAGPPHPLALLTGGANELSGRAAAEAEGRLTQGQCDMAAAFGAPARGFVAPAWQCGRLTLEALARCGLRYHAGFFGMRGAGWRLPLATWSWDCGRAAALGLLGEGLGHTVRATSRGAVPCVVLHPADVRRGFLPRALRLIERLLAAGMAPALPGVLASDGRALA